MFLASLGLSVLAIDQSAVGMRKAQRLAHERGLALATQTVDLQDFNAERDSLDSPAPSCGIAPRFGA